MLSDQFLRRQQYMLAQKLLLFCLVKWASLACKITAKTSWAWLSTISQHGNFLAVAILDRLQSNTVSILSAGYGKMPGYEHIFTDFLQSLGQTKYQRCLSGGWSAGKFVKEWTARGDTSAVDILLHQWTYLGYISWSLRLEEVPNWHYMFCQKWRQIHRIGSRGTKRRKNSNGLVPILYKSGLLWQFGHLSAISNVFIKQN